ncbi:hypothetical protein L207DRAFT_636341 [Hyaloscypha variabilis F]|uniref:DUF7702 domain-containing protein n=1 Tax=Hyaloscypha variabilis (strain UAMH 11265 / GT02V1 / F) TaxID=1149755 RepID=A0A2J6RGN6_HYAVF|nr:hypothetical protein L207DRAFT_636341 [Hyaloscypha variabilis F]
MGMSAHSGVAIAQTVVYVPIVPLAIFITIRNRSHPLIMAWYPFILFSMMRLAGGPVVLALEHDTTSRGLIIAALILLNVGLIPLLVTTLGIIRLILADNPQIQCNPDRITRVARLVFIAAATLLSAGAGLAQYPSGRYLTVAGYALFAVILVAMIFIQLFLWRDSATLIPYTRKALAHATLAIPFLVVRTVYALADTSTASDTSSPWSPVYGNVVLFAIMCLLMEYIALCLYMWVGLTLPRKVEKLGTRSNCLRCNEDIPRCSTCVRRGEECTRNYTHEKRGVRFVQVKGEVVDGAAGVFATRPKKTHAPVNMLCSSSPGVDSGAALVPNKIQAQLRRFLLTSDSAQFSLLAKWKSQIYQDLEDTAISTVDPSWCFKDWTISVTRYIGTSLALDDAVKCYLDCRVAFANPTDINLLASHSSKFKAIHSIRLALKTEGSQPPQSNLLLAVQLLYMVEALTLRSHSTMVTHVKGLISLLDEYQKTFSASNADGNLVFSAMYMSAYSSGLFPALMKGEDHDLDIARSPDIRLPPSNRPLPHQATQQAWQTMAQSYVAIPRLTRLIRELQASPNNTDTDQEVVDLAIHLYSTTIDPNFLSKAISLGELWEEPTSSASIIDIAPISYGFKSRKFVGLLSMYWISRLLICGLVDKLLFKVPWASQFFDANVVEAEDAHIAVEVFKMVQYGFAPELQVDSDTVRIKRLQILSLLQTAFGAWYRIWVRASAVVDEGAEEREWKIQRAHNMKQLCVDLGNEIMGCMQLPLMTMSSMEELSEVFAGGPLVEIDLFET